MQYYQLPQEVQKRPKKQKMAMQKLGQVEGCGVKSLLVQGDVSQERHYRYEYGCRANLAAWISSIMPNSEKSAPSHEIPKDFDNVLSVNLRGAFLCAREAIKHFLSQNRGIIINVSSVHEIIPRPFFTLFNAKVEWKI